MIVKRRIKLLECFRLNNYLVLKHCEPISWHYLSNWLDNCTIYWALKKNIHRILLNSQWQSNLSGVILTTLCHCLIDLFTWFIFNTIYSACNSIISPAIWSVIFIVLTTLFTISQNNIIHITQPTCNIFIPNDSFRFQNESLMGQF